MNDVLRVVVTSGFIGAITITLGGIAAVVACVRIYMVRREARRVDECHRALSSGDPARETSCWMATGYLRALTYKSLGLAEFRRLLAHHMKLDLLPRLSRGRGFVLCVAGSSTSLGLLGTVLGMSQSFRSVAEKGSPEKLAGAIDLALSTTIVGLAVSLPLVFLLLFHRYLASGVEEAVVAFCDSLAERAFPDLFPAAAPAPRHDYARVPAATDPDADRVVQAVAVVDNHQHPPRSAARGQPWTHHVKRTY